MSKLWDTHIIAVLTGIALLAFLVVVLTFPGNAFIIAIRFILWIFWIMLFFLPLLVTIAYWWCVYIYFRDLGTEYKEAPAPKNSFERVSGEVAAGGMFTYAGLVALGLSIVFIFLAVVVRHVGLWIVGLAFTWL